MIDFEFYQTVFGGGRIETEEEFLKVLPRSMALLNFVTYGRASSYDQSSVYLKMAVCAIAEAVVTGEARSDSELPFGIKSENVDGYSVTYDEDAVYRMGVDGGLIYSSAYPFLIHTGLLDRSVESHGYKQGYYPI